MGEWYNGYDWDFYSEGNPRKVTNGMKTRKDRGTIGETWWSRRWLQTLESFGMGSRLSRGRAYARLGQVISIDITPGVVKAHVQGSMREPYKITIYLQPLSNADWEKVTAAMATQAVFAAKLLAGEMPSMIEEAFASVQISLFPTSEKDLRTQCNCPDWANPCKHTAAVYYILAEQFDEDPFLLFTLRGRTKEEIISALREKRVAATGHGVVEIQGDAKSEPEDSPQTISPDDYLDTFWKAGTDLDTFVVKPQTPAIDKAVLKRLGPAPLKIGQQNVTDILRRAYDKVSESIERENKD